MLKLIFIVAAVASIAMALSPVGRWLWFRLQAFRQARAEKAAEKAEEAAKVNLLVKKVTELIEWLSGAGE
jgi:hypothetical protein